MNLLYLSTKVVQLALPVTQHILPAATLPLDPGKQAKFTALVSWAGFRNLSREISFAIPYGFL